MSDPKKMVLSALFHPPGVHKASWLRPDAVAGAVTDIEHYREMAQLCEKGCFDLFFIADTPAARTNNLDIWKRAPLFQNGLEPMTLLAAIAGSTTHIGLGATVSTSFFEPYNIARQFASLDHISGGRAAWNIVTSANDYAARNFGLDKLPEHSERYARARESYEVVTAYWDTWEDDAFSYDKQDAVNFQPEKFHSVDYAGKYFTVSGGLNVARSPQGYPVIIQAGASETGKEFAAETAEVVFGTGSNIEAAKAFYQDLKGRMAKFGRNPDELKVLSGFGTIVADTEEEAKAKMAELEALVPIEVRINALGMDLETNLMDLPLDELVPVDRIPEESNLHKGYFDQIAGMIRSGQYTLRQIANLYNRDTTIFCGSAIQVADVMQDWIEQGASDGFMIAFPYVPTSIVEFIEKVVPILQARGLMKTQYDGKTLRENLGLERPENRHIRNAANRANAAE
jgi:N-acetyl-S-(2-succino)cysteine monooxygenase